MRDVEEDAGNGGAQDIEQAIERRLVQIAGAVEERRGGQQAELVAALRQQPVDQVGVEAIGAEHRLGDALGRILVEVEAGRAEGNVEIDDNRGKTVIAGDGPRQVVADRRRPNPSLGADDRDGAADGVGTRRPEKLGERGNEVENADRCDEVLADATAHQLAVQHDFVGMADDDDLGAGVAGLRRACRDGQAAPRGRLSPRGR